MKTLILYYSKHGITKKVARLLNSQIVDSELSLVTEFKGDLSEFDDIYLGSPTYMGKLNKDFIKFIKTNREVLIEKPVKVFVVGMAPEAFPTLLENHFDKEQQEKWMIRHVGGGYNFNSMNFIERFVARKVGKVQGSTERLNESAIEELAK